MKPLPKFLKIVKAINVWEDGDTISFIWNWWHPLAWLLVPFFFILSVILYGLLETIENSDDIGLGLSEYWKENKDKRKFL